MAYYFYLARCADGSLYSGSCIDPKKREAMHNAGKGAKYTRSRLPVSFVYTEKFSSRNEAMRREALVKQWSRAAKIRLLNRTKTREDSPILNSRSKR